MATSYKLLPSLVKHMTVAIYRAKRVRGATWEERYYNSWVIARTRLVEYGYLKPGSESGPVTNVIATAKGAGKSRVHNNDGETAKTATFDKLAWILEQRDNPPKEDKPLQSDDPEAKQLYEDSIISTRATVIKPGDIRVFNKDILNKVKIKRGVAPAEQSAPPAPVLKPKPKPKPKPKVPTKRETSTERWQKLFKRKR